MVAQLFDHVAFWVFDLDNTLYPPQARLFDQIEVRMTAWVMDELKVDRAEADRLRRHYWQTYGTTLAGLMKEHDIDPAPYLTHVHEIDLGHLEPEPALTDGIRRLPGRKIVYTNGSRPMPRRVIAARGLDGLFDAVYGVEHAGFRPKPERAAFEAIFTADGLDATRGAMFEDDARNLAAPHAMGMRTVHVAPEREDHPHVHHHTIVLSDFLTQLGDRA
jgi:putative hydrolase of the HAD superfamily